MAETTTTQRRVRFERLVREAEASIASNPRGYKLRLIMLALLGYAVLFGTVALLLGLIGGTLWGALASTAFLLLLLKKKLIIPLLAVIWVILRSLWVRVEVPTGFVAGAGEFPALHAEVEALRRQLDTPAVHEMILTHPALRDRLEAIQAPPRRALDRSGRPRDRRGRSAAGRLDPEDLPSLGQGVHGLLVLAGLVQRFTLGAVLLDVGQLLGGQAGILRQGFVDRLHVHRTMHGEGGGAGRCER
jgi:hypothetical protein